MRNSPFISDILKGQVALITGGGSGVGFEIAKTLGLHGSKIVIFSRNTDRLKQSQETLQSMNIDCNICSGDIRNVEDCKKTFEFISNNYGKLDILVNNAGGIFMCPAENMSSNGFRAVMEIDAVGTFNMTRHAFELLKKSANPNVINISATMQCPTTWYLLHACAAKSAVDSMTRSFACEWGDYGIKVNGVAPGAVPDTIGYQRTTGGQSPENLMKMFPLKRMAETQDVALCVLFLCSDAAYAITGQTLIVDGGATSYREPFIDRSQVNQYMKALDQQQSDILPKRAQ